MAVQIARKLFSIEEYERMIEAGVFEPDARLELIHGEIVEMAPIGVRHAGCVTNLNTLFHEQLGQTVIVWVQNPIRLPDDSQPQPDIALLKRRGESYSQKLPTPEDVLLLVEVSDTTLDYDRGVKLPMYAGAGIGEVWVVNLQQDTVEVYSSPTESGYGEVRRVGRGGSLLLPDKLGATVRVDDILA